MSTKTLRRGPVLGRLTAAEVRERIERQFSAGFEAALEGCPPAYRSRLVIEATIAFRETDARRLGSIQLVRDTETGWMGLACGIES